MVKFKSSLVIIVILLLLPTAAGEVEIKANGESDLVFVDAGDVVTFSATGLDNTTSIEWDFGRDIGGNGTRYSNLSSITHNVHASGRYNVTFTASYDEEDIVKELILIVNYEEEYQEDIVHNEALFFAIAGSELIMSAMLGYWTHQIRKEKVYLCRRKTAKSDNVTKDTTTEIDGKELESGSTTSEGCVLSTGSSSCPT